MRKLVLLVCVLAIVGSPQAAAQSGLIPTWESHSGRFGFFPITNEISIYQNYDDAGEDRGRTLQVISINSLRIWTSFTIEFTGDFNYQLTPGLSDDHYIELSLVKPVTPLVSLNYQRVMSTFEAEPVNQLGVRLSF